MPLIATLAEFVTRADAAALPAAEQALLRRHVLDTVVAAATAARSREGASLAALFRQRALPERIGQRAATIRLSEIDDIHLPSCTTPSAAAVATALSVAHEAKLADPAALASAIWVGTELMTALGEAVRGPDILYRGVWPSCFAAPFAVAATAARMRGLDAERTAHALSLALMLTTRGSGRPHGSPSARWVMFASAVAAGISAVDAIAAGYHGDPALLDGPGFEETWGFPLDRERLAAVSTKRSVYRGLSIKPFCSAKQSIAAVEALRAIFGRGVGPQAVAAVQVRVPPAYAGMISTKAQDGVRTTTLVSVARQLAYLACDPQRLYDVDRGAPVTDPAIRAFEAKVAVVADPALMQYYPGHWPAEVEARLADGTSVRERVIEAPGDPEHPLGDDALAAKAHGVLDGLVGREATTALVDIARRGLADEAGCRDLTDAFADWFGAIERRRETA